MAAKKTVKKTVKTKVRAVTSSPKKGGPPKKASKLRITAIELTTDEPLVTGTMTGRATTDGSHIKEIPRAGRMPSQHAPHGIVRARAGTGKTFTLIMGVANMLRDKVLENSYTFRGPGGILPTATNSTLWGKVEKECGRTQNPLTGHWEYPEEVRKVVPSTQQQAVWDFMAKEIPRTVCYVAFNNSIVEEFGDKYQWLVELLEPLGIKLTFSTIHSLGNQACKRHYQMRGWKSTNKYRVSDLLSVYWEKDLREVWKEKADLIKAIQELVGLCKLTLSGKLVDLPMREGELWSQLISDETLEDLCIHYGISLDDKEELFKAVRHLLGESRNVPRDGTGRIDFNDMIWLPVVNNLEVEKFDLLLVDEAQDLNRCQQELVLKAGKRIILVGDERQAIYGFAGADTDSMDRMQMLLGSKSIGDKQNQHMPSKLVLTQTRRCGKAIVEHAKRLVPDFEAHKDNPPGSVARIKLEQLEDPIAEQDDLNIVAKEKLGFYSLGESDMVLCRTNTPLVGLAFRMLKAGKRVNIKGRDIGDGLKAFIKKSGKQDVSEFLVWLEDYQKREVERIQKRRNVDSEALVTLEDKCMCLRTFSEGAITVKDLYKSIDSVFKGKVCPKCRKSYDENQKLCWDCKELGKSVVLMKPEGTLCSSIHRAKGLEAKRVFILRPDLMPHPMAKTVWAKGQEANLQYVAETRAIEELVYVDGKQKQEVDNG